MLLEIIECKQCGKTARVRIGTKQHEESLCYDCYEEKDNEKS